MAALTTGNFASDFSLKMLDGSTFSLKQALATGPVVAAFFKVSCPVCQYAFPFLERLHKNLEGHRTSVIGISQNDRNETDAFAKKFGVTFPMLLDDARTFPVSNAYGLTNVPTLFYIAQDGEIQVSSVGWSRADMEQIAQKASMTDNLAPTPLFQPNESIADFRAG